MQILHIGSYDNEGPSLHRLHSEFMPANGFAFAGPEQRRCWPGAGFIG